MVTGKRKYRVLVAGANDKLGESIAALLPKNEYEPPVFAASVGEIRRLALESTMDLVVLNTPSSSLPSDIMAAPIPMSTNTSIKFRLRPISS